MTCNRILSLKDGINRVKTALCVTGLNDLVFDSFQILTESELRKYDAFKAKTGKMEFLLGRYSAKIAYFELTHGNNFLDIEIANGIFEQPFFMGDSAFDLSIAHSKEFGGAIVFDKAYPIGLDIETVSESSDRLDVLSFATKYDEIEAVDVQKDVALTIAWCMKEALTKAIRTGLTIPLDLLCLDKLTKGWDVLDTFECEFKNFPQYKGIAKVICGYVMAIVYPKQLLLEKFE